MPGFEMGVTGMMTGDTRTLRIAPEDGFGFRDDNLIEKVKKSDLPDNIKLQIGKQLMMPHPDGDFIRATVIDIKAIGQQSI